MAHEDKIILSSTEFPGNSRKKTTVEKAEAVPREKRTKVASARRVRRSLLKRVSRTFEEGEPGREVINYVLYDVVIPAAKSTLADLVEGTIEMVLFGGDSRNPRVRRSGGRSYVSYADAYKAGGSRSPGGIRHGARRPHDVEPATRRRGRQDISDIVLGSRPEAEKVLEELAEIVQEYGVASVADLYDLVGLDSEYTDQKFGWLDLEGISTMRGRDGWELVLPNPRIID